MMDSSSTSNIQSFSQTLEFHDSLVLYPVTISPTPSNIQKEQCNILHAKSKLQILRMCGGSVFSRNSSRINGILRDEIDIPAKQETTQMKGP